MKISHFVKDLEMKVDWKLSRNSYSVKRNFFLTLETDGIESVAEIAPNIRYGETYELIEKELADIKSIGLSNALKKEYSHATTCALVCANLSLKAQRRNISISKLLDIPNPKNVATSFSVPIMNIGEVASYLKDFQRYKYIKIKVNQENAYDLVNEVCKSTSAQLRVDGNEAWKDLDSFKRFEEKVQEFPIQFIEQPFKSEMIDDYIALQKSNRFEIMADESIEDNADFSILSKQFNSINIKLMKTGGPLQAVELIKQARNYNLKIMIGCMIETSLGISYAMELNALADYFDLDGFLLIKKDPFSKVIEREGNLSLV